MDTYAHSDLSTAAELSCPKGSDSSDRPFPKARKRRAAFSLVEVTFSIGIVAFGFVTTLGLLPTGLTTFRRAMDASIGSQIAQHVINDAQQTDFGLLTSGPQSLRYFDDEGKEVIPTNPANVTPSEKQKITYWVNTQIVSATPVPTSTVANTSLATVKIQVANNPSNSPLAQASGDSMAWSGGFQRDPSVGGAVPIASYWTLVSRNR